MKKSQQLDSPSPNDAEPGNWYMPCAFFLSVQPHPEIRRLWRMYAVPKISTQFSGTFQFKKNMADEPSYYTRDWLIGVLPETIYNQIIRENDGDILETIDDYTHGAPLPKKVIGDFLGKNFDTELYKAALYLGADFGPGSQADIAIRLQRMVAEVIGWLT